MIAQKFQSKIKVLAKFKKLQSIDVWLSGEKKRFSVFKENRNIQIETLLDRNVTQYNTITYTADMRTVFLINCNIIMTKEVLVIFRFSLRVESRINFILNILHLTLLMYGQHLY